MQLKSQRDGFGRSDKDRLHRTPVDESGGSETRPARSKRSPRSKERYLSQCRGRDWPRSCCAIGEAMVGSLLHPSTMFVVMVDIVPVSAALATSEDMGPLQLAGLRRVWTPVSRSCRFCMTASQGFEVPPVPAPGQIRRGRLARPQDAARFLRLPRREPGPDPLRR